LEAYPGFTDTAIAGFADDAKARFGLQDYAVVHRIGRIAPGEAVVFVATAAAHRRAAFEACDLLMDYLKSRAPFWKKEHGPDGGRWIEPTARDRTDAKRWD
jgi:molybdopterin synthase catalytic subunit